MLSGGGGSEERIVTILITPERPRATGVRCAALSWTLRGRLRNGCE